MRNIVFRVGHAAKEALRQSLILFSFSSSLFSYSDEIIESREESLMIKVYFDSSAYTKLFADEDGSETAKEILGLANH